jgi:ABC-2 type transport system permease protein
MWNLIKLEWRKNKITSSGIGFIIANIILLLLFLNWGQKLIGVHFSPIKSVNDLIATITMVFVIYGGILFVEIYCEEYEYNTIKNSLTLPQGRKNIIISKVLAALIFTIAAIVGTYVIQGISISIAKNFLKFHVPVGLSIFTASIPELLISLLIASTAILVVVIICFFIKSSTFNVFVSIGLGMLASISSYLVLLEANILVELLITAAALAAAVLIFLNRLASEVKKDIS